MSANKENAAMPALVILIAVASCSTKYTKPNVASAKNPGAKESASKLVMRKRNAAPIRSRELAKIAIMPVNPAKPIENSASVFRASMISTKGFN